MLTKLYAQPHFLKLKGNRNLHRSSEYVLVAFKCPELKIETGVRGYLAVAIYIFFFNSSVNFTQSRGSTSLASKLKLLIRFP